MKLELVQRILLTVGVLPCLCSSFLSAANVLKSASPQHLQSTTQSTVADDLETSRLILRKLASRKTTQTKLTPDQVKEYKRAIDGLASPPASLDVDGGWDLLATISPEAEGGDNVDFFDINSWKNYIAGTGPSPFQSLVTGSSRVNGLTQWLTPQDFDNVVEFKVGPIDGKLVLKASLEKIEDFDFVGDSFSFNLSGEDPSHCPILFPSTYSGTEPLGGSIRLDMTKKVAFEPPWGTRERNLFFSNEKKRKSQRMWWQPPFCTRLPSYMRRRTKNGKTIMVLLRDPL
jgi:hypothetical protein